MKVSKILLFRLILSYLIFYGSLLLYPIVFETVGYMYTVKLNLSWINLSISSILIFFLVIISNFKCIIFRHTADLCILGLFLPLAVVVTCIDDGILYLIYVFLSLLLTFITIRYSGRLKEFKIFLTVHLPIFNSRKLQTYIFLFFTIFIIGLGFAYIDFIDFNIWSVYERTYEIRADRTVSGVVGYLLGFPILFFYPILLAKGLENNKKTYIFVPFFGAILIFIIFATKISLLFFLVICSFGIVFKYFSYLRNYIPHLFYLFFISSVIAFGNKLHSLWDRFFYLIGLNSYFYFDFFSRNNYRFFEGTKFDLGLSNYGEEPGFTIDNYYYQGLGVNQSAGYLPTMFADLGVPGLVIFSVILGVLIKFLQKASDFSFMVGYLLTISLAFSLQNTPFNMLFLTNGLFFSLLFLLSIKKKRSIVQCLKR